MSPNGRLLYNILDSGNVLAIATFAFNRPAMILDEFADEIVLLSIEDQVQPLLSKSLTDPGFAVSCLCSPIGNLPRGAVPPDQESARSSVRGSSIRF